MIESKPEAVTLEKTVTLLPSLKNPCWDHEAEPPLHRFYADSSMDPEELSRKVAALCQEGNWYISLGGEAVVLERATVKARTWLCSGVIRYTNQLPAIIYERDVAFQGLVFEPAEGHAVADIGISLSYDEKAILCASPDPAAFPCDWRNPDWNRLLPVHDWRSYVNAELRSMWPSFTEDQRRAVYEMICSLVP